MDTTKFKALLDDQMNWPDYYKFKFITETDKKHHLLDALTEHNIEERSSKNGKYVSITSKKLVHSSDEVIAIYSKISKIEGVISL